MAFSSQNLITPFLLFAALALSTIHPSTCQVVKAKVSCLDCSHNFDLSGMKVSVKCEKVKNLVVANTESDGSFEAKLPYSSSTEHSVKCLASLMGGVEQVYALRKDMVSQIVKANNNKDTYYTISSPLRFMRKSKGGNAIGQQVGSSKTVDVPLPREWGLAPSSYYVPFFPIIIGIP